MNMYLSKKTIIVACIILINVLLVVGCAKKETLSSRQAADKFVALQLDRKYKEAYDEFYPKDIIGGYKGFVGASKRIFDNFKSFKFVKVDTANGYIYKLKNEKDSWLIFIDVAHLPDGRNHISFGKWHRVKAIYLKP